MALTLRRSLRMLSLRMTLSTAKLLRHLLALGLVQCFLPSGNFAQMLVDDNLRLRFLLITCPLDSSPSLRDDCGSISHRPVVLNCKCFRYVLASEYNDEDVDELLSAFRINVVEFVGLEHLFAFAESVERLS